jgi:Na+(H+)/acetate symporter ActP
MPLAFLLAYRHGGIGGASQRLHSTDWLEPMHGPHSLYLTYSLVLATFLGTMGLPHVVVRFYTNRDGFAARRTTVAVLGLLSLFYLLPPVYGVLGRRYLPLSSASDASDTAVLDLPHIVGGSIGDLLIAVLAAGAFAAFLSTSSGLVLSIAGVLGQDVLGHRFGGITAFRIAAGIATVATLAITLLSTGLAVAHTVELAFAVAASTFCPMLLLGIWWPRLSAAGAVTGMGVGGLLSTAAVVVGLSGHTWPGLGGAVLSQPALVTVPLAFATMVVVSLATTPPAQVARTMVRLHAPEDVMVDRGGFRPRGAD